MRLLDFLLRLFFPPKCVLCGKLLRDRQTDLCHHCRIRAPIAPAAHKKLPYLDRWTAVWYYEDTVRHSILRFKFRNARSYAHAYGRMLAMALTKEEMTDFDILSWVPVSPLRRFFRGYDQCELLAQAVAEELEVQPLPLLKKIRHNRPQSQIEDNAARRANVLGAYKATDPAAIAGKRILLIDDVITTGATAGECARTLRLVGAKSVNCAAVARRHEITKTSR